MMKRIIYINEIAKLLKTSLATIKRDFKKLKEKGIIERVGSEKTGHWQINL